MRFFFLGVPKGFFSYEVMRSEGAIKVLTAVAVVVVVVVVVDDLVGWRV